MGASWCIRGNCIHHQDGSYTLMETAGFCEKFVNSVGLFCVISNSNHGSTFCFVLKMSSTSFLKLSNFSSDVNFVVLSGFGCQHCVDMDHIANPLEELAIIVPAVNISSMEIACSSETVDALAPFHILRTCNSKIILMNSLNICDYFCRS